MRYSLVASLAVAALLVHGGAATAAPTELRPLTLGIGGTAQIGYVTMTLADRLGYYRDAGLKITFANFQGGTKSVEALVGGSVDVVGGAYDNILILQSKGILLTTIFNCVHNYGYVFGMLPARAGEYHSPKDLKGMKIGVSAPGSATENLVRILLGKASLSINDIATIGVGLGAGSIAALTSGRVDAVVTGEPDITRMIMDHEFVALVDTRTKAGMDYAYGGQAAGAGSFMTRDFIAAHRDLVQAYVTALYRAQRWLATASLDDIADTVPQSYWGGDKEFYKAALATTRGSFTPDGRITQAEATVSHKALVAAGRLPADFKVDFKTSFDDSFVEHAIAAQQP